MSPTLHVPPTLSTPAREALTDYLTGSIEVASLLDPALHSADTNVDVAAELIRAGYLAQDGTDLRFTIDLAPPPPTPSDAASGLHDAITALAEVLVYGDHGFELDEAAAERIGITSPSVLAAVRAVLLLALHDSNGALTPGSVISQFPHAAAALARAVTPNHDGRHDPSVPRTSNKA